MINGNVEIVLHVDESLQEEGREKLIRGLGGHPGVSHAHFTPQRPHLVVVDYDPKEIHSRDVLNYVIEEHVHAELIGGL